MAPLKVPALREVWLLQGNTSWSENKPGCSDRPHAGSRPCGAVVFQVVTRARQKGDVRRRCDELARDRGIRRGMQGPAEKES